MNIKKIIISYLIRSAGLLFYFTSFPFIIYGLFYFPIGNIILVTGVSLMIIGILLIIKVYGNSRIAFRKLALMTLIPLIIFVIFNIAITATVANILRGEIEDTIGGAPEQIQYFLGIAIENYMRIIPGLWITAIAYALMTMLFIRISSRK
jgi:hypothetical protein